MAAPRGRTAARAQRARTPSRPAGPRIELVQRVRRRARRAGRRRASASPEPVGGMPTSFRTPWCRRTEMRAEPALLARPEVVGEADRGDGRSPARRQPAIQPTSGSRRPRWFAPAGRTRAGCRAADDRGGRTRRGRGRSHGARAQARLRGCRNPPGRRRPSSPLRSRSRRRAGNRVRGRPPSDRAGPRAARGSRGLLASRISARAAPLASPKPPPT